MRVPMAAVLACISFLAACDDSSRPLDPPGGHSGIREGVCYSPCVISITYAPIYVASVRMTDLGFLPGATNSDAHGVNDAGQIVGNSVTSGTSEAVLWNTPSQIKPLFPGVPSSASGINASGMIAGTTTVLMSGIDYAHGFLWNNGTVTDLAYSNPAVSSYGTNGYAVNDSGTVTGDVIAQFPDGTTDFRLAYWPAGSSLGTIPAITPGETFPGPSASQGNGINDRGVMAGDWDASAFTWQSGQWSTQYALSGATQTYGMAINDSGAIAATALLSNGTQEHGALINAGGSTDIGTLRPTVSTANSIAWGIDSLDLIVGASDDSSAAGVGQSAILWGADFGMYRLPSYPGTKFLEGAAYSTNPHVLGDSILVVGSATSPVDARAHATLWSVTLGLKPVLIIAPGIWALPRPFFYWDPRYTTDRTYDRYVRVVFFGGPNFNAQMVDPSTLLLNGTKVYATAIQDVNKDGTPDLVMLYSMRQLIRSGSFTQRTISVTITGNLAKIGTPLTDTWPVSMCLDTKSCLPDDTVTGF